MLRSLLLLCAVASISTAPAHVVVIADGSPDWAALLTALPAPDVALMMRPCAGCAGGLTPESAEVASAMSTGCTGARRAVSAMGTPLGTRAAKAGAATGLVTNACPTDPTVAAFFASSHDRYDAALLAGGLRDSALAVMLGGASRLLGSPEPDACHPRTRRELAASVRSCDQGRLVGSFGNMRSALAEECQPLPLGGDQALPNLADMTASALAFMRASTPDRGVFLVVGNDRMDHAAHAGDEVALVYQYADTAAAVKVAISALAHRNDSLVVVTGDHATVFNGTAHSAAAVPVLVYGSGAREAASRIVELNGSSAFSPPVFDATDFPKLFPFFVSGSCEHGDSVPRLDLVAAFALAGTCALALVAFLVSCVLARRAKKE